MNAVATIEPNVYELVALIALEVVVFGVVVWRILRSHR